MVHELSDSQGRIDIEVGLLQRAPLPIGKRPGANERRLVQDNPTVIDSRRGHLRKNEEIRGTIARIQTVDRQNVTPDTQKIRRFTDVKILEHHRPAIRVGAERTGVPLRIGTIIAGSDPLAVQVGDEAIIVFHPQRQEGQPLRVLHVKLDPQIAGRVDLMGQLEDVRVDQVLEARVSLVTDTGSAAEPGGVVEIWGDPVHPQGVVNWNNDPHRRLRRKEHLGIHLSPENSLGSCLAAGQPGIFTVNGIVDGALVRPHGQDKARLDEAAPTVQLRGWYGRIEPRTAELVQHRLRAPRQVVVQDVVSFPLPMLITGIGIPGVLVPPAGGLRDHRPVYGVRQPHETRRRPVPLRMLGIPALVVGVDIERATTGKIPVQPVSEAHLELGVRAQTAIYLGHAVVDIDPIG